MKKWFAATMCCILFICCIFTTTQGSGITMTMVSDVEIRPERSVVRESDSFMELMNAVSSDEPGQFIVFTSVNECISALSELHSTQCVSLKMIRSISEDSSLLDQYPMDSDHWDDMLTVFKGEEETVVRTGNSTYSLYFTDISEAYQMAYQWVEDAGVENGMSQMEAYQRIEQYICEHVDYDEEQTHLHWTNVLYDGMTCCSGYSELLLIMCRMCNIECTYINGVLRKTGESHAWNRVKLDGRSYLTDLTFTDGGYENTSLVLRFKDRIVISEKKTLDW